MNERDSKCKQKNWYRLGPIWIRTLSQELLLKVYPNKKKIRFLRTPNLYHSWRWCLFEAIFVRLHHGVNSGFKFLRAYFAYSLCSCANTFIIRQQHGSHTHVKFPSLTIWSMQKHYQKYTNGFRRQVCIIGPMCALFVQLYWSLCPPGILFAMRDPVDVGLPRKLISR